jgi:drug/metabolite transporter (DMT)-like permease
MSGLYGAENWAAYLLALLAGLIYAGGAIAGKKALELGCGQVRTVILSNLILSVCFIPHFFLSPGWPTLSEWITGTGLGAIFLLAQALLFRALRAGDASMVSPLMGIKSILVAFFLVILGFSHEPLSASTWCAAGLTALAVALIGWPARHSGRSSAKGILLALASAAAFSLLDSMVPHFSHQTDPIRMLFCIFGSLGFLTLFLLPWKEEALFRRGVPGDNWVWRSGLLIALQAVLMSTAIACYRVPTEVNVVYSSRGLWTLLFVAWLGKRLGLNEGSLSPWVKARRLAGCILLGVCILLIA